MPRRRSPQSPTVVYRTARVGVRVTRGQRRRLLLELLVSAGDVWACVLEINVWRRARQDRPLVSYQELCRELAASGPGCFGELDSTGARSMLRRYCDAWFAAAKRRRDGDDRARFPRRRRALVPLRWYHGKFALAGRRLRIPVARGNPPLWVRLDRDLPYLQDQVRSVTLLYEAGRLWVDVTAEVPVACYPLARSRIRPGWRGWIWGSSTRMRWLGPKARRCWCRGGRSGPSTGCTWPTARPTPGRPPAARPCRGRGGRGGGGTSVGASGWPRRGTGGGCARPSTRPPKR
jgi:hypothetical protein